ncbi:hypothetical protein, partial [Erwinia tasmaniensis]|uniref:hypothetical protein n=1 Tax=Erwinia tasmaniensis TaxID=338565 RepID=UPI003A4D8C98
MHISNQKVSPFNKPTVAPETNLIKDNFPNQISTVKQSTISINRHGNTFQGLIPRESITRQDSINSINTPSVEKNSSQKTPYTPL